jgi:hypothetical protein
LLESLILIELRVNYSWYVPPLVGRSMIGSMSSPILLSQMESSLIKFLLSSSLSTDVILAGACSGWSMLASVTEAQAAKVVITNAERIILRDFITQSIWFVRKFDLIELRVNYSWYVPPLVGRSMIGSMSSPILLSQMESSLMKFLLSSSLSTDVTLAGACSGWSMLASVTEAHPAINPIAKSMEKIGDNRFLMSIEVFMLMSIYLSFELNL